MSLFDSAMMTAADTTQVQAGGESFLGQVGDALTYGTGAAVVSGLGSIYNTAAHGINALGGDVDVMDTAKLLGDIDENWAKYYKDNQNAIDTVGFIGTSFIPGTLAIKGLNLARGGANVGAFGRALGFARTQQAASLDAALVELAAEGGTVFTRINKNKLAAMGWGFADQTLTAAAFETGVALTMKQSPLLADDSWWDIGKTAMIGAAFGGVIGGSIDALILNKGFKTAVSSLEGKQRGYDALTNLEKFNIAGGDKSYAIAESLVNLPTTVLPADEILKLSFHLSGGKVMKEVDISKILGATIDRTQRDALIKLETSLRELSTDTTVNQAFADLTLTRLSKMREANASSAEIKDRMGGMLFELKSLKAATEVPTTSSADLWYFNKAITPEIRDTLKSLDDYDRALRSSTPFASGAYSKPYMFMGNQDQKFASFANAARIGGVSDNGYPTLAAAWKAGHDVAFMPDGALRVNDASTLWRRVDDPVYSSNRFVNTRSGAMTEDTVLTAADMLPAGKSFGEHNIKVDKVYLEGASGTKQIDMTRFNATGSTKYFTARHAWASKLADDAIPVEVNLMDFSLMDRLRSYKVTDGLDTRLPEIYHNGEFIGNVAEVSIVDTIKSAKLAEVQRLFKEAAEAGTTLDVRAVAYQLNVESQWIENAVATRFAESPGGALNIGNKVVDPQDGVFRPLDSYMRRENLVAEYTRPQQFQELNAIKPDMSWQEKKQLIMDSVDSTGGQFVTGELAWGMRVQEAIRVNKNAAGAVLGSERTNQLMNLAQDAAKLANSTGSGSSTFGAANAGYGDTLKLVMQDTGKHVHGWIQQDVNDVVTALGDLTVKLRASPTAASELGIVTNLLRSTDERYVWSVLNPKQMILRELGRLEDDPVKYAEALRNVKNGGRRTSIDIVDPVAFDFLKTHTTLNSERINKRMVLNNAKGFQSNLDGGTIYVPPIDTTYFKHFAFVRPIEGKAFSTSEVSMIFGRDADELSKRLASVDSANFQVVTKADTERFYKAKEAYDFDLTINEPRINSELRKSGALNNFQPEVRAENIAEDYLRWHQNQAGRLVRDAVETNYAQQFAEIRALGTSYTDLATSRFAGNLKKSSTEIADPFDDYLKTALDISKRSEYTFLHQANEFVDALGTRAYRGVQAAFGDASKGITTWQQANAQMEKLGIKGRYSGEADFFAANVPRDRNIVREYVSKANSFLANTVLRLDFFNSITNVVSTPMMLGTELASIRNLIKNDPVLVGKLADLTTVTSPGGVAVPSTTKLIAQAVTNFFGPEKELLLARYKANGDVKDSLSQFHSMLDNLSLRADFKVFSKGVNDAFEMGARLTLNEQAEQMTRFISADVMRQVSEPLVVAGKLSLQEQNAYISVFTNRVQGNYISSQRPIVFQGVLGSAVSLFQTYSFNLMQQLLRHVENGDKKAVATLFGMQASTFGLNGTPFFDAVNTNIIGNASINQGHYDAYSVAPALLGKKMGDWLMYGTASAFPAFGSSWPALYTRGDINPRHMTILPINPLDIPAVQASSKVVGNLMDIGSKMVGGANIGETLLQGLEHNGISRPLAGLAQILNGKSTTSKGGLISASSDFDMITTAARIGGAKPMDESIALNQQYRMKSYQIADAERMDHLGERVKSYLYKGQFPPDGVMDTFMSDYARSGGRVENFNSAMQRWSKDANVSTVEKMRTKMNSPYGQRLNEIMGGIPLQDYSGAGALAASQVVQPPPVE